VLATMGHEEKYLLIGNVVARHRKPIARCSMSVPIPPPATAPISPPKEGEKIATGCLVRSPVGAAPPYDQPRQPILPAIIVAAQPAIVVVAAHLASSLRSSTCLHCELGRCYADETIDLLRFPTRDRIHPTRSTS
jgi:hypothetical protein